MKSKTKLLLLFPLLFGTLASCGGIFVVDSPFVSKDLPVYDLRGLKSSDHTVIPKAYDSTVYTLASEEHQIPYLSLKQYGEWMERYFDDKAFSNFTYTGQNPVWQVYMNSDKPNTNPSYIFFAILDVGRNALYMGGSLYNALTQHIAEGKGSSLSLGLKSHGETYQSGRDYSIYSFANATHGKKYMNRQAMLPLGIFDAAIGQTCGVYHLMDQSRCFVYDDPGQTYLPNLYYEENHISVGSENLKYFETHNMPMALREYERDILYFVFDNRYGLTKHKGISSMSAFYKEKGIDDLLLSANAEQRQKGFFDAVNMLDDLHTSPWARTPWWGDTLENVTYSNRRNEAVEVMKTLTSNRTEAFGENLNEVRYHEDMAYIYMQGFEASFAAYEDDGETVVSNIADLDTYFYMVKSLQEVKSHGGIKDVVIDLSTNGGGYVTIMEKIVTLLSKDNSAHFGVWESKKDILQESFVSVDTNDDGLYDENDVFGNDFNFHTLTSICSFSAGNAMPAYARRHGFAKTLGENSGGGECTVESVCLPSGRGFHFSTATHMVYIEGEDHSYSGVEGGAGIDIALDYDHFYDLPYIYEQIH